MFRWKYRLMHNRCINRDSMGHTMSISLFCALALLCYSIENFSIAKMIKQYIHWLWLFWCARKEHEGNEKMGKWETARGWRKEQQEKCVVFIRDSWFPCERSDVKSDFIVSQQHQHLLRGAATFSSATTSINSCWLLCLAMLFWLLIFNKAIKKCYPRYRFN